MEAQARREKQLKIGAAAVVVVVLVGIVAVVVWNKAEEARAEEYAANWITCEYPEDTETPEKLDPSDYEDQGPEVVAEVRRFNEQVERSPSRSATASRPRETSPAVAPPRSPSPPETVRSPSCSTGRVLRATSPASSASQSRGSSTKPSVTV